jgi:hypothetical protein
LKPPVDTRLFEGVERQTRDHPQHSFFWGDAHVHPVVDEVIDLVLSRQIITLLWWRYCASWS